MALDHKSRIWHDHRVRDWRYNYRSSRPTRKHPPLGLSLKGQLIWYRSHGHYATASPLHTDHTGRLVQTLDGRVILSLDTTRRWP